VYWDDPYVQQQVVKQYSTRESLINLVMEAREYEILTYMADIASGRVGDPRAAVQAARFLDEVQTKNKERLRAAEKGEAGPSQARALMDKFMGVKPGKVLARRVTEEIELSSENEPEGDIIDGEVSVSGGN
jgi:hypothetical protein